MFTDSRLAYDVRAHFGLPPDDALSIVEYDAGAGWVAVPGEGVMPEAQLILALVQGGVVRIAVACAIGGRVAEFDARELIVRSGDGRPVDRVAP